MSKKHFRFITEKKSVLKCFGILLLALALCVPFLLSAAAEEKRFFSLGMIDLQKKGSIHIVTEDTDENPVSGGFAQIYCVAQVAESNGKQILTITDDFSDWNGNSEVLFSDGESAESLAAYVTENKTAYTASAEIKDGTAVVNDLAPGAYLVMQNEPATGYEKMSPFLAFLPQQSGSELIYDVQAHPKPVKKDMPGSIDITAQKEVYEISGKAPEDTLFSFVLTAESPEAPMPENNSAVYNSGKTSMTVSRNGAGSIRFGTISFSAADAGSVYEYTLREVKGSAAHYTYDTNVYKLKVTVSEDDDKELSVGAVYTDQDGKQVSSAVFRNVYDTDGNTPILPHTGQLWWPVFVMVPGGFLFIVIGIIHFRRGKAEEAEDAA